MTIADEKYVSFSTHRKNGAVVSSPVWIVALGDGRMGFWTSSASGKVKRLHNNPSVTMQPCDQRGRVKDGADTVTATAALVTEGSDFDAIQSKVRAKYGAMVPISRVFNTIGHLGKGKFPYGDIGVVLTLGS